MQRKRINGRSKRTLHKLSSSPYNSSPSRSTRSSKSTSSSSSQEPDPKIAKNDSKQGPQRGPEIVDVTQGSSNSGGDDGADLLKSLNIGERTCSCVCLDAKPVGKHSAKLCGWESKKLSNDSKNPYHLPIISGDKDLAEMPEVKMKRRLVEPRLINSSSLGYIPTANVVKHYSFKHCIDGDTSSYMREYREKYSCRNSTAKVMGLNQNGPTHLNSNIVSVGFDSSTDKKGTDTKVKTPPRLAYGRHSSASIYGRRASIDGMSSPPGSEQHCSVQCPKPSSSTSRRTVFPHEKYIAKYRMQAMEEKRAREMKYQPSLAYKTDMPKLSSPADTNVILPFKYRPPSRLFAQKKVPHMGRSPDHSVPKYVYTRNNWRAALRKNCSNGRPSSAGTGEEFYSIISADMSYLGGAHSTGRIDVEDNSPFLKQRQIRTNAVREWKHRTAKSMH